MTGDRATEIRERVAAATPGPWSVERGTSYDHMNGETEWFAVVGPSPDNDENDFTLIAHAPADLRYLLDENAKLTAALGAVRELPHDAREEMFEGVFELDEKYSIGCTNSPDMHPDAPEAGDLCGDVLGLYQRAVTAAITSALGEDQ